MTDPNTSKTYMMKASMSIEKRDDRMRRTLISDMEDKTLSERHALMKRISDLRNLKIGKLKAESSMKIENVVKSIEHEISLMEDDETEDVLRAASRPLVKYQTVKIVSDTESEKQLLFSDDSVGYLSSTETEIDGTGTGTNITDLNLRISDADLKQLMSTTTLKKIAKGMLKFKITYMPAPHFEKVVKKLYKCCLKSVTDLHELHLRRLLALPLIQEIILRADPEYISTTHIIHIVWSIMSCLHHFQLRLKSGSNKLVMHNRQKMVDKCMNYYFQFIRIFGPKAHKVILSAIITFYKDGKLWDIEFACTDMIVALLKLYVEVEDGINDLLNAATLSTSVSPIEAQKLMQVVYEVLRLVQWKTVSTKLMDTLIRMLHSSIAPKEDSESVIYVPLKMGIDLCIRHLILNISNKTVMVLLKKLLKQMIDNAVTDDVVLYFGNLARYAASNYKMKSFYNSITPDLLYSISFLAHEINPLTSLTAIKIWLKLIDRSKNSTKVNQPRIFFQNCDYKITMKTKCSRFDKLFFKTHRNHFYELIIDCFKDCSSKIQINAIFEMSALLLLEIPCGHTAATFTSVAMTMQEYALQITKRDLVMSHYLHATALSILSLICYIHKAQIFYNYVTHIVARRAEWAPHLIPPLKAKYEYAIHHVLWSKPDLYFEDWETRYGLWKCFRVKKKKKIK